MQFRPQRLFDEGGVAFLNHHQAVLALRELKKLIFDKGIGDVQHIERHVRVAVDIRKAQPLQPANDVVVHTALQHDADLRLIRAEHLVQLVLTNVLLRGRQAFGHLLLLMQIALRRQDDALAVALGVLQRVLHRRRGADIVAGDEFARHMARADADHQHDG